MLMCIKLPQNRLSAAIGTTALMQTGNTVGCLAFHNLKILHATHILCWHLHMPYNDTKFICGCKASQAESMFERIFLYGTCLSIFPNVELKSLAVLGQVGRCYTVEMKAHHCMPALPRRAPEHPLHVCEKGKGRRGGSRSSAKQDEPIEEAKCIDAALK